MNFKNGIYKIIGDSREVIKNIPSQSIHAVVTSPPYFNLRDYKVQNQIGIEKSKEEYLSNLILVFKEVFRVLRDDGTLWVNINDSYSKDSKKCLLNVPFLFVEEMKKIGWIHRQSVIWYKPNGIPESVTDRCVNKHEYLFLFSKKPKYFFDNISQKNPSGSLLHSVWAINTESTIDNNHTAVFPEELVDRCLRLSLSKYGVCSNCSKPIDFKIKKIKRKNYSTRSLGGNSKKDYAGTKAQIPSQTKDRIVKSMQFEKFTEIDRQCLCKISVSKSSIVLDPFSGSGTVGKVAKKLGNRAVLIDLQ
jgi:site-specific DNA-methyltransferase (adenine-specific)